MDESLRLPPRLAAILEDLPLQELAFEPVPVKPRRDGLIATLNRLLDDIDPAGAARPPRDSKAFLPRFA